MTWLFLGVALLVVPLGSAHTLRLAPGVRRRESSLPVPTEPTVLLGIVTATCVAVDVIGIALGTALGIAGLTATRLVAAALRRTARARADAQLIAAVRALVAELDAGRPLDRALEIAGLDEASYASLGHARRISADAGAPLTTVLGTVVEDFAADQKLRHLVAVKISSLRASALMMAVLPVVGIALGTGLGAQPLHVLVATPLGHALLLLAVVFESAGLLWTDAIARRASIG